MHRRKNKKSGKYDYLREKSRCKIFFEFECEHKEKTDTTPNLSHGSGETFCCYFRWMPFNRASPYYSQVYKITQNTQLRLIDFGFSMELKGQTLNEEPGLAPFLAPEMYFEKKFSKFADFWSIG